MNKIALSAALILATASTAFAENNAIPGERNPNPVAGQFDSRSVFEARAQVGRGGPVVYIEKSYLDRASQTFDGPGH
ncbi:MAG: hypothetical protein M5U07_07245 [Xanthobacteraceae bacterium]|nr:hypothetical protein [Xanthobacteraceae bacterium]PWB64130.1 MAG: hypothetical protein C3F17_07900 [Bradyrhizobiaceae bacterium]